MSTQVEVSIPTEINGGSDELFHQEPVDEGDSHQRKIIPTPAYKVENNAASDSGVSNASSVTSDYTAPLNNGDIHEVSKSVTTKGAKAPVALRSQSTPINQTNLLSRSFEAVHVDQPSLLDVSGTEHGLSMLSLEVMTSGEQLNLIGEDLENSEGSLGSASRSISPDVGEDDGEGGAVATTPSPETG